MSIDRSSALLVRVWLEGGPSQFRARVMVGGGEADDVGGDRTIAVLASPDEVVDAVRRWLGDFMGQETGQP